MREVFVHADYTRVGFYKSILDQAGILSLIRNDATYADRDGSSIFHPSLCVERDEDYEKAMKLLGEFHYAAPSDLPEWHCAKCEADVPGNFDLCWQCGTAKEGSAL